MKKKVETFFDLTAWQEAHKLALEIYQITKSFPSEEKFGITNQIRRAVSSITANIAEGFARYHFKDKIRFYHQARASVAEVQNFLALSQDLRYLDNEAATHLLEQSTNVAQLINGMVRSIEKQQSSFARTNYKLPITNSN